MRDPVSSNPRVIVQILGGLGNQMFAYAAARRLAVHHDAELLLDTTSRLAHDPYGRRYMLDRFSISGTTMPPAQGSHRGWRNTRRSIMRRVARRTGGMTGRFLFDLGNGYQPALLTRDIKNFVLLDGLWQDSRYFEDIQSTIRDDFRLASKPPADVAALGQALRTDPSSVSVHLRSYAEITHRPTSLQLGHDFLSDALARTGESIATPALYIFTDNPEWAHKQLHQANVDNATIVDINADRGDDGAVLDMWLMSQCSTHIISNSTFSWWGAWLDANPDKLVIAPAGGLPGNAEAFPRDWVRL